MDAFFGQLPYKCHLEEVASVGDWLIDWRFALNSTPRWSSLRENESRFAVFPGPRVRFGDFDRMRGTSTECRVSVRKVVKMAPPTEPGVTTRFFKAWTGSRVSGRRSPFVQRNLTEVDWSGTEFDKDLT